MKERGKTKELHMDELGDLRDRVTQLERTIDHSTAGIHIYQMEPDGRLILIETNASADQILGFDNKNSVASHFKEAFPPLTGTEVPEKGIAL